MEYAIALDFGGTNIRGAVIDENGKTHLNHKVPTQAKEGKKQILFNLLNIVEYLREKFKKNITGIGISMPGCIDSSGKIMFGGGTLKSLIGLNLKRLMQRKTGLPVYIENDANCFALAEAVYGAGKKYEHVIGIIWGTGIGGGIIVNKKVFDGSFGGAGEFGHMVVDPSAKDKTTCGCGQKGCLEMMSSGKNVVRKYYEGKGKIKDANVTHIFKSVEPIAKKVIADMIHNLGVGLANLTNILNPDIIVIGGGVSLLPDKAYKLLNAEVKKYALPSHSKNLKIVRHAISDDAGLLGAAALVFEN